MRNFDTGATRDSDVGKPDYAGYLSPLVIKRYGLYMLQHQKQADGQMRASDNWKKGIPKDAYMSSMFRHFMDVWTAHDKVDLAVNKQEALCALMFNVMGYLYEELKTGREKKEEFDWYEIEKYYEDDCVNPRINEQLELEFEPFKPEYEARYEDAFQPYTTYIVNNNGEKVYE